MENHPDKPARESRRRLLLLCAPALVGGALLLANCDREGVPKPRETHILSFGYLSGKDLPNALALVPPPPAQGSPEMQRDEAARLAAITDVSTSRVAQAARDSVLAFPQAAQNFSCALGVGIDKEKTPLTYNMLAKMLIDVRASAYPAKNRYKRMRPFVVHGAETCAPAYAETVRADGSYPSGQAATGWAYALVLSEVRPQQIDSLTKRAADFGQSRLVCDVQWESDISSGRTLGQAIVAKLREEEAFKQDLAAVKAEIANAVQTRSSPPVGCAAEAAALKDTPAKG